MMIKWGGIRQENWMRVDWGELDNHTEWLAVMGLDTF